MDITLTDLMQLEHRLSSDSDGTAADDGRDSLDVEVSWAVTARVTAPFLPATVGASSC